MARFTLQDAYNALDSYYESTFSSIIEYIAGQLHYQLSIEGRTRCEIFESMSNIPPNFWESLWQLKPYYVSLGFDYRYRYEPDSTDPEYGNFLCISFDYTSRNKAKGET